MPIVQFAPFSSLVQPSFWHELTSLKVDVLRLSDDSVPITASYTTGKSFKDRDTGQEIALGCNITVGSESFEKDFKCPLGAVSAHGTLKNFNTIEDFKAADKSTLFNHEADAIWESIIRNKDTSMLTRFLVISYADLKKYKYYYWFAFPAFASKPAWEIEDRGWVSIEEEFAQDELEGIFNALKTSHTSFFVINSKKTVSGIDTFADESSPVVAFIDPSASPSNPGWPLRNLLAYLHALYPSQSASVRVLCWRDHVTEPTPHAGAWKGRYGVLHLGATSSSSDASIRPSAVGWEKNNQGKLAPRVADLAPMMDPTRPREGCLNALPATWCGNVRLLCGPHVDGTSLFALTWNITFVDSARVSFSNPVRQPLFEFEDCLEGGKPKAACAAERLKKIFPGVNASGHNLSIPMPGHPIPPASVPQAKADVEKLEKLFDEHDAVFLLMDSRESRWLPTVMGAAKGKIVMNAALGFDTFLVMRHGARGPTTSNPESGKADGNARLGCYYCNDIVAPADSLTDRTLDQMCTVTRPGLASIAASTAVELLVSLIQHSDGVHAPAPPPQVGNDLADPSQSGSVLGLVPHQLRGFLAQFRNMPIVGAAYERCTGCSETVLQAYEKDGFEMLLKVFNENKFLEKLTGLDKLYEEGQAALDNVDWDIGDDESD
ncbi:hypothetical protein ONZ45_g15064 [Pleurotus djamor]|nr:hypothetical protein ONZ45_g15064 [Pleurotus djamor]